VDEHRGGVDGEFEILIGGRLRLRARSVCIAPEMIGIIVAPRSMPDTNSVAPSAQ
jgi:hypothetical protein